MTKTHLYDPLDASYYDDDAARAERDRTFQICSDCRICVKLCPSFKDLFRMIDERDDGARDVSFLSDAQHRQVVDECYQCKLCYVVCPYTPDQQQEWKIDFPRLMLRSAAMPVTFSMTRRTGAIFIVGLTTGANVVATLPCRSVRASSRALRGAPSSRVLMAADRSMRRGKSTFHSWCWSGV